MYKIEEKAKVDRSKIELKDHNHNSEIVLTSQLNHVNFFLIIKTEFKDEFCKLFF